MTHTEALQPCPFCGGEAKLSRHADNDDVSYVICDKCGACCSNLDTRPEADCVAAWNRRAAPSVPSGEPFGYVLTNNVPESSPYRHLFYKPDQINAAYKDNALHVVPVYAAPQPAPAGWRLVPETPTHDMVKAGRRAGRDGMLATVSDLYRAMLAAAPAAPGGC